jgi:hypothetical protein
MKTSALKMHKYVLAWVGLLVAFGATIPIAMLRVSRTPEFAGQPFNSQTCEAATPETRLVVNWKEHCLPLRKQPLPQKN